MKKYIPIIIVAAVVILAISLMSFKPAAADGKGKKNGVDNERKIKDSFKIDETRLDNLMVYLLKKVPAQARAAVRAAFLKTRPEFTYDKYKAIQLKKIETEPGYTPAPIFPEHPEDVPMTLTSHSDGGGGFMGAISSVVGVLSNPVGSTADIAGKIISGLT